MNFTFASLLEWTKLTVRAPAMASALVKAAKLPIEVSALMIVLAGVVSGLSFGLFTLALAPVLAEIEQQTGQVASIGPGPLIQGILSSVQGLAFAFTVHRVGRLFGGTGTLADIFAVTAVVQIVLALVFMVVVMLFFVVEIVGAVLALFSVVVFFRGLGHAVKVGHNFNSMGKSAGVILLSFCVVVIVVSILSSLFGLTPPAQGEVL